MRKIDNYVRRKMNFQKRAYLNKIIYQADQNQSRRKDLKKLSNYLRRNLSVQSLILQLEG